MTESTRDGLRTLAFAAALALAAFALASLSGPGPVVLNLGPGDAPYLRGFTDFYEIEEKVATHWSSYDAGIDLPLQASGTARMFLRFARVFGETAQVDVRFAGRQAAHLTARGGVFVVREIPLGTLHSAPLSIDIRSDSHEGRNLGLKLDWVSVEAPSVQLAAAARFAPVLLVLLLFGLHRLAGWDGLRSALWTLPWLLLLGIGSHLDPWLVHRLVRGLVLALSLFGLLGVLVGRWLQARGQVLPQTLRRLAALALIAFLSRGLLINHPDFYYPDQRTHARLVEKVQEGGLDFFASPAKYIWAHGVWRTEAHGRTYAFPYSPAFHLPFTLLRLPYDDLLVAMKLTAAALTTIPLLLVFALARRFDASPLGALLMLFVPTYTSRLSFAFLPALFGHAMDIALIAWLAWRLGQIKTPRVWATGALMVAACQLAYISGVMNISLLIGTLAVVEALRSEPPRWRVFVAILGMGAAAAAVAVALYYRDFLGMVFDLIPRIAGHEPGGTSRYPVQGFFAVAWARTHDFFDGLYPGLALAGLVLLLRRGRAQSLLLAWSLTYLLLLLGRAKVPDVFLHGHETLLVTPLVCLAAGVALHWLWSRGRWLRALGAALLLALAVQGAWFQWQALSDQLANAR